MNWELIHRFNSLIVGAFIVGHLGVHLMAVVSPELHGEGLVAMGRIYSEPIYEGLLIVFILIQIFSGYMELKLFGKSGWKLVRNLSGAYLLLFMLLHVVSVFYARYVDSIPTDFYWVAGAFANETLTWFAVGFYGLAVFSFFTHMIAVWALHWKTMPRGVLATSWIVGISTTALILLAFSGSLYSIEIPDYVSADYEAKIAPLLNFLEGL